MNKSTLTLLVMSFLAVCTPSINGKPRKNDALRCRFYVKYEEVLKGMPLTMSLSIKNRSKDDIMIDLGARAFKMAVGMNSELELVPDSVKIVKHSRPMSFQHQKAKMGPGDYLYLTIHVAPEKLASIPLNKPLTCTLTLKEHIFSDEFECRKPVSKDDKAKVALCCAHYAYDEKRYDEAARLAEKSMRIGGRQFSFGGHALSVWVDAMVRLGKYYEAIDGMEEIESWKTGFPRTPEASPIIRFHDNHMVIFGEMDTKKAFELLKPRTRNITRANYATVFNGVQLLSLRAPDLAAELLEYVKQKKSAPSQASKYYEQNLGYKIIATELYIQLGRSQNPSQEIRRRLNGLKGDISYLKNRKHYMEFSNCVFYTKKKKLTQMILYLENNKDEFGERGKLIIENALRELRE